MGVKQKVRRLEGSEGINQGSEVGRTRPREEAAEAKSLRGRHACVCKERPEASVAELREEVMDAITQAWEVMVKIPTCTGSEQKTCWRKLGREGLGQTSA